MHAHSTSETGFSGPADAVFRFWSIVDETLAEKGETAFLEDGELKIESFVAAGKEQLSRYFAGRLEKSATQKRKTRHLITNIRVLGTNADDIILGSIVTVFSGYGSLPLPLSAPSSLCDFTYRCRKTAGGEWKFVWVDGSLIFAGNDTPDLGKAAESVAEQSNG